MKKIENQYEQQVREKKKKSSKNNQLSTSLFTEYTYSSKRVLLV